MIDPRDLPLGLGLLTRLPVRVDLAFATARGGRAAWTWPMVGAILGAVTGGVAVLAQALGLPAGLAAMLALATGALLTGALHEDGLADVADGLWGGHTQARRLEIMKDSRIGSYGTLALILVTLGRWSALTALLTTGAALPALIAAGALSRVPMVLIMAALPNARGSGLSHSVGAPPAATAWLALAVGLVTATLAAGWAAIGAAMAVLVISVALAALARAKIGGQTGDVLGASQQLAELAALGALSAA
jgi:adenosylcobinamide-GDP ribazoletransferase